MLHNHHPLLCLLLLTLSPTIHSQTPAEKLTVEKIMQDPKWIGTSPSDPYWSGDGKYLFFKFILEKSFRGISTSVEFCRHFNLLFHAFFYFDNFNLPARTDNNRFSATGADEYKSELFVRLLASVH